MNGQSLQGLLGRMRVQEVVKVLAETELATREICLR